MKKQNIGNFKVKLAALAGSAALVFGVVYLLAHDTGNEKARPDRDQPAVSPAHTTTPTSVPPQINDLFARINRQIELSRSRGFSTARVVGPASFVDAAEYPQYRGRATEFIKVVSGAPDGAITQVIAECNNGARDIAWASVDMEFPRSQRDAGEERFALRLDKAFIGAVEMQNGQTPETAKSMAREIFARELNGYASRLPSGNELVYKDQFGQFNAQSDVDGKNYDISMTYFWNNDIR